MNHLSPQELTEAYYGEAGSSLREHIRQCRECAEEYRLLEELLHAVRDTPVPEPEPAYENGVWARLAPQLAQRKPLWFWMFRPWVFAPALLALLALAFFAGRLTQPRHYANGISAQARERVLLLSLSDHLERSQTLLTELSNVSPESLNLADERSRARDLLEENRLLRQASNGAGEAVRSAALEDLEQMLLDLANAPPDLSADNIRALQTRIKDNALLFKARVTSAGARREGQKL